jgi:hypothetical protein
MLEEYWFDMNKFLENKKHQVKTLKEKNKNIMELIK